MSCQRCGSDRLFRFEPGKDVRVTPDGLPTVCRGCGQITINGVAVQFPAELESQAKTLANAAEKIGAQALEDLKGDPDQSVKDYFNKVYKGGYLEGFFRAFLFLRHSYREGRLRRLRELWKTFVDTAETTDFGVMVVRINGAVYAEFKQLIELGDPGAASSSNDSPPISRSVP